MPAARDETAGERPFNNLLRRVKEADLALVAPALAGGGAPAQS